MEEIHEIKYGGKTYKVYEPTLDIWSALMTEVSWSNDFDLAITLLSWVTGLEPNEIRQADAMSIINVADGLVDYYTNQSSTFHETFTFAERTYKFIDLPSLSFGEYIDIDDLLRKPLAERNKNLNLLMAMLYREVDEKGNYLPYDIQRIKENADRFRKLPIKYLNGSLVFFYSISNILYGNTPQSLTWTEWIILQQRMVRRRVKTLSDGMQRLLRWPERVFLKWKGSFGKII